MTEALLDVAGLQVPIGAQTVLRGVDLRVPAGGIVCVLGSNGVGKTTLMRTVSGIYRNATGAVRFAGQDIINRAPHEIVAAGISQAPEGRHIFPTMTVAENLRVGAGRHTRAEQGEDAERIFALFPVLRQKLRQWAGSLSGGEQQMLCIGRAMMARPRLLLLDEPSLGLAPRLVRLIFDLVARIREGGTAILLVEQNARAALRVSDHAYVMEGGRIVLDGPAAQVAGEARVTEAYLGGAPAPSSPSPARGRGRRLRRELMTRFAIALAVATLASSVARAEDRTLVIGCSLPLSGPMVGFGGPIQQGAALAVEEFNAAKTVPGTAFRLDCADSKGDAKETVNIAGKLVDDARVIASISDFTSTATMAAADTYAKGGLVQLTPSASHPDLVKMNKWMFRTSETIPTYIDPLADFITQKLGKTKIAVVQVQTDWGQSVGETFVARAKKDGAEIVDDAVYNQGTTDFRAILTRMRREKPDAIFLAMLEEEAATFMKQRKQLGLTEIPVVDSGVGLTERSLGLAGDAFDGMWSSRLYNPQDPSPVVQGFIKTFTAKYGKAPDIWSAYGFDAANVIMEAARRAGPGVTRAQEQEQLAAFGRGTGANGSFAIDPQSRDIERFGLTTVRVENGKIDYAPKL